MRPASQPWRGGAAAAWLVVAGAVPAAAAEGLVRPTPGPADAALPATAPAPALRTSTSPRGALWVLDTAPTSAAPGTPAATPRLATQVVGGQAMRVLPEPALRAGPAAAAAVAATSTDTAARRRLVEQVRADGTRMLVLPEDLPADASTKPVLVQRVIDPAQSGTHPGDSPAPRTLYRMPPTP